MTKTSQIDIGTFWQNVAKSGLLTEGEFPKVRDSWESRTQENDDPSEAARWLIKTKKLSDLHAQVLLRGHSGPFTAGRYVIFDKAILPHAWSAFDQKTSLPVLLHFFKGTAREDLPVWDEIEKRVDQYCDVIHPNVLRTYESVVTRTHRFVATAKPAGVLLSEKLPLKTKLKEKQAIDFTWQISSAVKSMHARGIEHGRLELESIFFDSRQSLIQVAPNFQANRTDESVPSIVSLGKLLFRFITGRELPDPTTIAKAGFSKFSQKLNDKGVREPICRLIFDAVTCTSDFGNCHDRFRDDLQALAVEPKTTSIKSDPREVEFLKQLEPWNEPAFLVEGDHVDIDPAESKLSERPLNAARKPRPVRWSVATSIAVTLIGFAALIGAMAGLASLKKVQRRTIANVEPSATVPEIIEAFDANLPNDAELKKPSLEEILATQSYVQDVISDDKATLWESPTTGFPIDVSQLPPSPRMIATIRWNQLITSDAGNLGLKATGPYFDSLLQTLESQIGFPLIDIALTTHSFHSNLTFDYDVFTIVEFSTPKGFETCTANWGSLTPVPGIENAFESENGLTYWIAKVNSENDVVRFAFGPSKLLQQAASGEIAALSGTMLKLVDGSDANRHVNFLFPMISIFNTEGQKLFYSQRRFLNELRILLPTSVRGGLISLHFDDADYVEFRIEHTSAMKSADVASQLRDQVGIQLEQVAESLQQTQTISYWEPLRSRFPAMLAQVAEDLRWDAEFGKVIGNVWLPPRAIHNLLAAAELAFAFKPQKKWEQQTADAKPTPQTLLELLNTRRDLKIANPPDLNVLLADIAAEVSDEYLDLPFKFNIQLAGTDLQLEGITQNQRPAALEIENQTVAEILTQVMVAANPNRDISGPSDANCKLVWVIVDANEESDEQVTGQSVLITTRAAAAEKGYRLPEAFIVQP